MKIVRKVLPFAVIALIAIILLVVLLIGVAYVGLHIAKFFIYSDYYIGRETVSTIPNLNGGFVPQGIAYDQESGIYYHSGYNGTAVEYYTVNGEDVKKLFPIYANESQPAKGHGGGIAVAGDYVYAVDNSEEGDGRFGTLHVFLLSDFDAAKDGDTVKAVGSVPMDTCASFCFTDGKILYVGEFYRAGNYETVEAHHVTTPAGDQNNALITAFPLNADGSLALETPIFAISITDLVQGFAITKDGKIALSRSWSLSNSHLDIYNGWTDNGSTITIGGNEIPLCYLDSATHEKQIAMPAFSEGLALLNDDTVIISFESACNKYIIGKLFFAYKVVSFPLK